MSAIKGVDLTSLTFKTFPTPRRISSDPLLGVYEMLFLTNEPAKKAEINILTARDTTGPGY